MNTQLTLMIVIFSAAVLSGCTPPNTGDAGSNHAEHNNQPEHQGHGKNADGADGKQPHDGAVELTAPQRRTARIRVETLRPRKVSYRLYAPGEVVANGYRSYLVAPRVDSVVLKRHVVLGEHVSLGQPLVTLTSGAVASAQSAYRNSAAEWQRVRELGRQTVGARRFVQAESDYREAAGRLRTFGLSEAAIRAAASDTEKPGEYTLVASVAGVVLADNFHQGQPVVAGDRLLTVSSEKDLWVEARLPADRLLSLPAGSRAIVRAAGMEFPARVAQEAHAIDAQTRTRVVRLLVDNGSHRLHPGIFADVYFLRETEQAVMAVPESALVRGADGDWTLYVERQPDHFAPVEVRRGRALGQLREISGLPADSRVVTDGAFFVASQGAKDGFDPHNH
ncbi:efflux RND transporter periplasmic adaptor subunit [Microbulbifer hainanensis]|uniref:efflux RND transporter periplasmic adaptor subunit n=1 Tax=Microbulbifer hainanensis TaxID=2735675 RepID=UPI0018677905|nr:efflux RND transporter periplasmic adaptor subunit [Microbulbifer hainanensis]